MKAFRSKKTSSKKSSGGGKHSFIMMVGDEGGILLHMQGKAVIKRIFSQSPEPEHNRGMDELLKSFPKAPVTLLVDMMDQSYVRQTLPPVSSLNVGKIIRRRLNKDFSQDDIKGYVIFGRDKKGRKDWNYLMASLANPPLLQKWLEFIMERSNGFKGIGLVPLECQPLVKAIEAAELATKEKDAKVSEWHIVISHHKVGGFRQVVFKNSQLVFTRLAQLVGEPTPEIIAGNIEQEMLNTLEYLKRLGLNDNNELTATIIASSEIKSAFDPKTIRVGQCNFYTPYEIAVLISMEEIAKPEDHFGDVVIAGFIARRRKLMLTLVTAYTSKIAKIVRFRLMARGAAALILLGILGWMGMSANDWMSAKSSAENTQTQQNGINGELALEEVKEKAVPQKVNMYMDVASLFGTFYRPVYDPLDFAQLTYAALGNLALVKSYHWSVTNGLIPSKEEDKRQINAELETILTAPQEPREAFVTSAQNLVTSVKRVFSNYDVTNTDLPGILSESKELKTVINDDAGSAPVQSEVMSNTIKFTLKGPVTPKAGAAGAPAVHASLNMPPNLMQPAR